MIIKDCNNNFSYISLVSLSVFRAVVLLIVIASPCFLKAMQQDSSMVDMKKNLMMLSQGFYELYPAKSFMFRVNINKTRII